jgi:hypothetical protein
MAECGRIAKKDPALSQPQLRKVPSCHIDESGRDLDAVDSLKRIASERRDRLSLPRSKIQRDVASGDRYAA